MFKNLKNSTKYKKMIKNSVKFKIFKGFNFLKFASRLTST